jgi:hypothetical protein
MKIPVYDPQINASTTQYNAVADIRTNTLGEIADGLQQYGKFREAQLEEERKTEQFKADSAIRYELDDAHSKMLDSIQNGGAYADAEAKYQKTFDDTVAKYMPMMGDDPNVTERFQAEYKRYGLGQLVQLRNTVQARRQSDAVGSAELLKAQKMEAWRRANLAGDTKAADQIAKEIPAIYSKLTAVGAMSQGKAQAMIMSDISNMKVEGVAFIAQTDPNKALSVLDEQYNKKEILAEDYIKARGPLMTKVEEHNAIIGAQQLFATAPTALSEKQMGVLETSYIQKANEIKKANPDAGQQFFYESQIDMANKTGQFGPQFTNQMKNMVFADPDRMSQSDKTTVSEIAKVYKDAPKTAQMKLDAQTRVVMDLINARIEAGMPDSSAVDQVLRAMKAIPTGKELDNFAKDTLKEFEKAGGSASAYLYDQRNWSIPFVGDVYGYKPSADEISSFENNYIYARAMGESPGNARALAAKDAQRNVGFYKGEPMNLAPSMLYPGVQDSDFEAVAVIPKLKSIGAYSDKYKYIIQPDNTTKMEYVARGQKTKDGKMIQPTYRIMMQDKMGAIIPVTDSSGKMYPNIRTSELNYATDKRLPFQDTLSGTPQKFVETLAK